MESIKNILKELLQDPDQLTPGQAQFVKSVERYYKRHKAISDKQFETLKNIGKEIKTKIPESLGCNPIRD
jgi:hypothetical protein